MTSRTPARENASTTGRQTSEPRRPEDSQDVRLSGLQTPERHVAQSSQSRGEAGATGLHSVNSERNFAPRGVHQGQEDQSQVFGLTTGSQRTRRSESAIRVSAMIDVIETRSRASNANSLGGDIANMADMDGEGHAERETDQSLTGSELHIQGSYGPFLTREDIKRMNTANKDGSRETELRQIVANAAEDVSMDMMNFHDDFDENADFGNTMIYIQTAQTTTLAKIKVVLQCSEFYETTGINVFTRDDQRMFMASNLRVQNISHNLYRSIRSQNQGRLNQIPRDEVKAQMKLLDMQLRSLTQHMRRYRPQPSEELEWTSQRSYHSTATGRSSTLQMAREDFQNELSEGLRYLNILNRAHASQTNPTEELDTVTQMQSGAIERMCEGMSRDLFERGESHRTARERAERRSSETDRNNDDSMPNLSDNSFVRIHQDPTPPPSYRSTMGNIRPDTRSDSNQIMDSIHAFTMRTQPDRNPGTMSVRSGYTRLPSQMQSQNPIPEIRINSAQGQRIVVATGNTPPRAVDYQRQRSPQRQFSREDQAHLQSIVNAGSTLQLDLTRPNLGTSNPQNTIAASNPQNTITGHGMNFDSLNISNSAQNPRVPQPGLNQFFSQGQTEMYAMELGPRTGQGSTRTRHTTFSGQDRVHEFTPNPPGGNATVLNSQNQGNVTENMSRGLLEEDGWQPTMVPRNVMEFHNNQTRPRVRATDQIDQLSFLGDRRHQATNRQTTNQPPHSSTRIGERPEQNNPGQGQSQRDQYQQYDPVSTPLYAPISGAGRGAGGGPPGGPPGSSSSSSIGGGSRRSVAGPPGSPRPQGQRRAVQGRDPSALRESDVRALANSILLLGEAQNRPRPLGLELEVKDTQHFETSDDKKSFYLGLPDPWDQEPRTNIKEESELRSLKDITGKFRGAQDGSYFDWRPIIIEALHKANISIDKKVLYLKKQLSSKDSKDLATLTDCVTFGPETYHNMIFELETQFGGKQKALLYVKLKLLHGDRLRVDSISSINSVRARLQNFVDYCRTHGMMDHVKNKVMVDQIFKATMNEPLLHEMIADHHMMNFEHDVNSVEIIIAWLKYKGGVLNYVRQRLGKGFSISSPAEKTGNVTQKAMGNSSSRLNQTRANKTFTTICEEIEPEDSLGQEAAGGQEGEVYLTGGQEQDDLEISDTETTQEEFELSEGEQSDQGDFANVMVKTGRFVIPECPFCKQKGKLERHFLIRCEGFGSLKAIERYKVLQELKLCFNCFSSTHVLAKCERPNKCKTCSGKHHTLLHQIEGKYALKSPNAPARVGQGPNPGNQQNAKRSSR